MYIVATPTLLRNSDVLGLASLCRELGASRQCRFDGGKNTAYGFDLSGEVDIEAAEWTALEALVASGLIIYGANMYMEMPNTALDNLVDVDLPGAKYTVTDEDGNETEVRRAWENTCPIVARGESNSLVKIAPCEHSDVTTSGYARLMASVQYKDYGITWDVIQQFVTWATDQGYNVLHQYELADWRATYEVTED